MGLTDNPSAIGAVTKALADFLTSNMPDVAQVLVGWPAPNEKLVYPSVTIFPKKPTYSPLQPYVIWKGTLDANTGLTPVRKAVGMYDFAMQLDLWAAYKPQRNGLVEELIGAFNQNFDVPGIDLTLTDYYGETCHLSIQSVEHIDDDVAANRNEWRAIVVVLCNLRVVRAETAHTIETIENHLETPDEIDADLETLPPLII